MTQEEPRVSYLPPSIEDLVAEIKNIHGRVYIAIPGIASALLLHGDFSDCNQEALKNIRSMCHSTGKRIEEVHKKLSQLEAFIRENHPDIASEICDTKKKT